MPEGEYADLSSRFHHRACSARRVGKRQSRVPIDHGQPFILPAWDPDKKGGKG